MSGERSSGAPPPSLESVQEVRLLALLHDLVRREGHTGAATALGVHRRTVAAAVNTGRLSRRMHDALGMHLLAGPGADAATASAAESRQQWEQHLAAALRRQREELLAAVSAEGQQWRDEFVQRTQALEQRLAALESRRGGESNTEMGRSAATAAPPAGTLVVSESPAPGEAAVFGTVAPLIVAWRQARDARAEATDRLTATTMEERLRELELALIETHGLTLPPAPGPWDSLTRRDEVQWRQRTLARVRGERRWAAWRRRLRRIVTLGLG